MLIGDMNARVRDNRFANLMGANGESTVNSNGRKLVGAN